MDTQNPITGRVFESPYLQWAKTRSRARFNLATSGVPGCPLADLGVSIDELEINGPGGYGYTPLREAIGERYGVPVENVVTANGTSGANAYLFPLLLGPGDEAAIEHPAYDILPCLARFTGCGVARFHRRPENGWSLDLDEIEGLVTPRTRAIILTNPHNPSSAIAEAAALRELGRIAVRHGAFVIVDEVYRDCGWNGDVPSAFHLGPNFIVTSSLTKVYGLSGLRCGWILAPVDIADRLWRLIDLFDNIPAHPAELLSVAAFKKLDSLRDRSRQLIETNRAIYRDFAGEAPEYGTVAFPRIGAASADELCEHLRNRYETTVVPGRFFEMPEHIRISLVTQPETLREGLIRVGQALNDLNIPQLRQI